MLRARQCLLQGVHLPDTKLARLTVLPCQVKSIEPARQATEALLQAQSLLPPAKLPKTDQLGLKYPQVSESPGDIASPSSIMHAMLPLVAMLLISYLHPRQ